MNLSVGIVGLPNVGKSTLFNALLKKQVAASANYPFTTIEPNVGVVEVPDPRLAILADVVKSSEGLSPNFKIIHATVEFVDIAGLVKGAHRGEGLGNKFLSHIREVDAIVFVVRDFKNPDIIQTGSDPHEDLEVLKSELLLKDLETVEKVTRDTKNETRNKEVLEKAKGLIEQGKWLAEELDEEEIEKIKDLQLLSAKKYLVVVNCDENEVANVSKVSKVENVSIDRNTKVSKDEVRICAKMDPTSPKLRGVKEENLVIRICAKLEEELAGLSEDEQKEYLKEIGIDHSGLEILAGAAYKLLDLETFLTAGPKEVRAWTIRRGMTAPVAAGVIHGDFERGFIAADVVPYDKFVEVGGWKGAREKGYVRTIGKGELMPEDVVVEFKFNV